MSTPLLPARTCEPDPWDQALMAFLAEKLRRSGSQRTAQGYSRMLFPFFARLGKSPEQVTPPEVMGWAQGIGLSGKTPSSTTIGARIACCLSCYYRFLRRMDLVVSNPCDALERPGSITTRREGIRRRKMKRLLAVVPDTLRRRRDRAILLTLLLTGRRRTKVVSLTVGDPGETTAKRSFRGR